MTIHHPSQATWLALTDEYLHGHALDSQDRAVDNATLLQSFLEREVKPFGGDSFYYWMTEWHPVDDSEPYPDHIAMADAWFSDQPMLVSDLYHDHPVWSRDTNLRFRIWHDTGHVLWNLGFDRFGETELFVNQALDLLEDEPKGRYLVEALFSESIYQLAASIALGTFPDQQHVRTPGPVARALLDAWGLTKI